MARRIWAWGASVRSSAPRSTFAPSRSFALKRSTARPNSASTCIGSSVTARSKSSRAFAGRFIASCNAPRCANQAAVVGSRSQAWFQVRECAVEVAACGRRGRAACQLTGGRGGGRVRGWNGFGCRGIGPVQREDRTAVVRDEQSRLLPRDVDAMRQEEVDAEQQVGVLQGEVAHAQAIVRDGFAAEFELRERGDPELGGSAPRAVHRPGFLQVGLRDAGAPGRFRRDHRMSAGVEQRQEFAAVELHVRADRRHLAAVVVDQLDLGHRRRAGPVGHARLRAVVVGEHEPDDAVREVVLGIRQPEDVASHQSHRAGARLVAADDEFHAVDVALEEPQLVDGRRLRVDLAGDALRAQVGIALQLQLQLRGGRVGQHAQRCAAVDRHRHRRSVDPHRRDGTTARERHRHLDRLDLAAGMRQQRQRERRCHEHRREPRHQGRTGSGRYSRLVSVHRRGRRRRHSGPGRPDLHPRDGGHDRACRRAAQDGTLAAARQATWRSNWRPP